jgi:hypothetical protein
MKAVFKDYLNDFLSRIDRSLWKIRFRDNSEATDCQIPYVEENIGDFGSHDQGSVTLSMGTVEPTFLIWFAYIDDKYADNKDLIEWNIPLFTVTVLYEAGPTAFKITQTAETPQDFALMLEQNLTYLRTKIKSPEIQTRVDCILKALS